MKVDVYKGSRSLEDLKEYVESKLSLLKEKDVDSADDKPEEGGSVPVDTPEPPPPIVEEPTSLPLDLTGQNFESSIESGFTIVKFYAPW